MKSAVWMFLSGRAALRTGLDGCVAPSGHALPVGGWNVVACPSLRQLFALRGLSAMCRRAENSDALLGGSGRRGGSFWEGPQQIAPG